MKKIRHLILALILSLFSLEAFSEIKSYCSKEVMNKIDEKGYIPKEIKELETMPLGKVSSYIREKKLINKTYCRKETYLSLLLLQRSDDSMVEIIKEFKRQGEDLNHKDIGGKTPLMWASYGNSNPKVIEALIENGAKINAQDLDKDTAIFYSLYSANEEIIKTLIRLGIDLELKNIQGQTAFMIALERHSQCLKREPSCLGMALKGCGIDFCDFKEVSEYRDIIKTLFKNPLCELKDKKRKTISDYAKEAQKRELALFGEFDDVVKNKPFLEFFTPLLKTSQKSCKLKK